MSWNGSETLDELLSGPITIRLPVGCIESENPNSWVFSLFLGHRSKPFPATQGQCCIIFSPPSLPKQWEQVSGLGRGGAIAHAALTQSKLYSAYALRTVVMEKFPVRGEDPAVYSTSAVTVMVRCRGLWSLCAPVGFLLESLSRALQLGYKTQDLLLLLRYLKFYTLLLLACTIFFFFFLFWSASVAVPLCVFVLGERACQPDMFSPRSLAALQSLS